MSHHSLQKQPRLFYTPCDGHQAGALLFTNRLYQKLDKDRHLPRWVKWLRLRDKWFSEQETLTGKNNFTCAICGKRHLSPWTNNKKQLATIDHIKPVSIFPNLWNVPSNFQVACFKCNQKKGNLYE